MHKIKTNVLCWVSKTLDNISLSPPTDISVWLIDWTHLQFTFQPSFRG